MENLGMINGWTIKQVGLIAIQEEEIIGFICGYRKKCWENDEFFVMKCVYILRFKDKALVQRCLKV
jgi:hypothetical protein